MMSVTRISKQGGQRYSQMGGSMLVSFLASVGTTSAVIVLGQSPGASRYRWAFHDSTVYK